MYLGATTCRITIAGSYALRGVHNIEIKRSVHQSIQTAKIELPLSVVVRNNELLQRIKLADKIKEGDSIRLEFGYDGKHRVEFEGYIRRIGDELPLVLECEDELYLLRSVRFKESFKSIKLKDLVRLITDRLYQEKGLKLALYDKMPDMAFSKFQMNDANGIEVLQELRDHYGLSCYLTTIDGVKTLYVGLAYSLQLDKVKYSLGRNTIGKGELKYLGAGDKKYKVKIVNFNRNGTKSEYEIGDKNGEQRTLYFYGDNDKAHLVEMAKSEMEKFSTRSYKGSFETFLTPFCEVGNVAELEDRQFPGRQGRYYVATVTTTFGINGGRRKPEIDAKLSV